MGNLEGNSDTWKNPGFLGFECRDSGIGRVSGRGRVSIFGFGSGSKKVGFLSRVLGSKTHH